MPRQSLSLKRQAKAVPIYDGGNVYDAQDVPSSAKTADFYMK